MRNLNRIHLNGLRAIEAVGRLGSLQAAALEIGVTTGAISQHIKQAEAQLGRAMFERTARGLRPTSTGDAVMKRLSEGFRLLSEGVTIAGEEDRTTLTISVAPVFASRFLVRRLEGFSASHPDIRLRIEATSRLTEPGRDDIDLAIRVGDGAWPGVRSELLLRQFVFPVAAPHRAASIATPDDLLAQPVVLDDWAMFSWEPWLEKAGLPVRPVVAKHVFNDASLCLDSVIAGQGVMLAWQTLAADAIAEGRLKIALPIRVPTGFGHYFVTMDGVSEPQKVRAFKQWMRAELKAAIAPVEAAFADGQDAL